MADKIHFTKKALEEIQPPVTGRLYVHDTKEPGLLLQVTPSGRKSFQLYRWHQGHPVRVTIGTFPNYSVENARKAARDIKTQLDAGIDPNDQARRQRQEMTFAGLFQTYMERHAKPRKLTWQEDEANFRKHLINLGKKQLSKISRSDIAAIHSGIGKEFPTHANRVLALVSSVMGRGIEYGLFEGNNPCAGIRRYPEKSRDRFLTADEIARFFEALEQEPNRTARDFFVLALLTGARRANVLSMKWADIDTESATWRIQETKNGTPQTVPLVGPALEILQWRRGQGASDFVFPGTGKTGHLVEPKKAWTRICKAAGIEDARIHDLRRTMGSWQAMTGASLPIIGKSLNHKSASTTQIYARLDLDPVRNAMETAVAAMLAGVGRGEEKE